MEQQRIEVVGKLGSTYGIRGWLRIYSSTEQAESIFDYQPWFLKIKGEWQPTELENCIPRTGRRRLLLARFNRLFSRKPRRLYNGNGNRDDGNRF